MVVARQERRAVRNAKSDSFDLVPVTMIDVVDVRAGLYTREICLHSELPHQSTSQDSDSMYRSQGQPYVR
jgi:hypothetical protein